MLTIKFLHFIIEILKSTLSHQSWSYQIIVCCPSIELRIIVIIEYYWKPSALSKKQPLFLSQTKFSVAPGGAIEEVADTVRSPRTHGGMRRWVKNLTSQNLTMHASFMGGAEQCYQPQPPY